MDYSSDLWGGVGVFSAGFVGYGVYGERGIGWVLSMQRECEMMGQIWGYFEKEIFTIEEKAGNCNDAGLYKWKGEITERYFLL